MELESQTGEIDYVGVYFFFVVERDDVGVVFRETRVEELFFCFVKVTGAVLICVFSLIWIRYKFCQSNFFR